VTDFAAINYSRPTDVNLYIPRYHRQVLKLTKVIDNSMRAVYTAYMMQQNDPRRAVDKYFSHL